MIPQFFSREPKTLTVDRSRMLAMLEAANDTASYRFSRQAALSWLTSFPGDLEINLMYARALVKENRYAHAAPVIQKILRADPEYAEAAILGEEVFSKSDAAFLPLVTGTIKALGGNPVNVNKIPEWGFQLSRIRQAILGNRITEAQNQIFDILTETEHIELVCYYHLLTTNRLSDRNTLITLAKVYHSRWPECVQIAIVLANALMDSGDTDEAVKLLHYCASSDPIGQVPVRLWGANFPYRPLYPKELKIQFDLPIPAEVAGKLGLNQLAGGPPVGDAHYAGQPIKTDVTAFDGYSVLPTPNELYPEHPKIKEAPKKQKTPFIVEVEEKFKKVANDIQQPALTHKDERYPAHVILSMRTGLKQVYGEQAQNLIVEQMKKLGKAVEANAGWTSVVFLPDDLTICGKYNITPVDTLDPWKIKLALVDLDKALEKTGERIGSVLIVGGDGVVPFHKLPNPTDDSDTTVPSDSPYAALDTNYFISDWAVGRLPGENGADPSLILSQLKNLIDYHGADAGKPSLFETILRLLLFWSQSMTNSFTNIGYTASVWRRSSLAAFRPVGEGKNLYLSPRGNSPSFDVKKLAEAQIGYFNVHGVEDGSDWYGQKDSTDNLPGPDFPVALTPAEISKVTTIPRIVYSEACYGGHIFGRTEDQSIALTMLGKGVLAMVGSTTISYGSVNTPLIGADLMGYLILKHLNEGLTIGASMLKAKIEFVREMNRRQGYLDGEDQKTLISFVLYGDPLVAYDPSRAARKVTPRELNHPVIKTISDSMSLDEQNDEIAPKMIKHAKSLVKDYLPGIENAEIRVRNQKYNQPSIAGSPVSKIGTATHSGRVVVSFSKQVTQAEKVHRQYARVTLDKQGKMVKLSVSR